MTASTDRIIGQLEGKIDALMKANEAASVRGKMYDELKSIRTEVQEVKGDVQNLSERVGNLEPGVEDYLQKQQQIAGAGKLGRGLWWFGGVILAAASWAGATWSSMTGRPPP